MRSWLYPIFSLFILMASLTAFSQEGWPKIIKTTSAEIRIFEFQPQSLNGNQLSLQSAISVKENNADPVFGMLWAEGNVEKDQSGNISGISSFNVSNIKLPGVDSRSEINELKNLLQSEIPNLELNIPMNHLLAQLEANQKEAKLSSAINTTPPKIIYSSKPSMLVFIDGQPQVQRNTEWGVDQVVNTPFTIIKENNQFYLYGNKKWFTANAITGNWSVIGNLPAHLSVVDKEIRNADTSAVTDNTIPSIIVSTEPAELIQSKGEANFSPVQGTNLLYMTNTVNDIFMDVSQQQYYVLISGRWYKAPNLNSHWTYIQATDLPEDFAKIPEGSAKDAVLASIAGTPQAKESVLDAEVPQTAKVDRNKATANVDYDGEPQFEPIEGTDLEYAVNTPGSVIRNGRKYYYVENGVWFESSNPNGPWTVATERPDEVANIPPSSPVYNIKYVYIYDATPDYVYMGYTPGYLGNYIYGPTIVYGTGYHYRPWRGRYYYARPVTWGFNMRYNPWTGWSFGFGMGSGWFFSEYGYYDRYYSRPSYYGGGVCWGGWWGPTVYRPQYSRPYSHYYGRNVVINNNYIIRGSNYNNVYRYRRDVVSYERPSYSGSRYRSRDYAGNYGNRSNDNYNNNRPGRNQSNGNINNNNSNNATNRGRFGNVQGRRFGTTVNPNSNGQPDMTNRGTRRPGNVQSDQPGNINNRNTTIGRAREMNDRNVNSNRNFPGNNSRNADANVQQGNNANENNSRLGRGRINPAQGTDNNSPSINNNNVFDRNRQQNSNPGNSNNGNGNFNRSRQISPAPATSPQVNQQPAPERRIPNRELLRGGNDNGSSGQRQPERVYTPQSSPRQSAPSRPARENVFRNSTPAGGNSGGEVNRQNQGNSGNSGSSDNAPSHRRTRL